MVQYAGSLVDSQKTCILSLVLCDFERCVSLLCTSFSILSASHRMHLDIKPLEIGLPLSPGRATACCDIVLININSADLWIVNIFQTILVNFLFSAVSPRLDLWTRITKLFSLFAFCYSAFRRTLWKRKQYKNHTTGLAGPV